MNQHLKTAKMGIACLGSRRPVQAGVKDGYPLKVAILPVLAHLA